MSFIRKVLAKAKRIIAKPKLKNNSQLIMHIGQHKSMTSYFNNVFYNLCIDFDWNFYKFFDEASYIQFIHSKPNFDKITIICCYNFLPKLGELNTPYIGSNIIRDPRDLLVSGYKYHKWTKENWANITIHDVLIERLKLEEIAPELFKQFINEPFSYKELLNKADEETGYLIEMNLRDKHFQQFNTWNFNNEKFFEIKYEKTFQNELSVFAELFKHYGFSEKMISIGLSYAKQFSFESLKKEGNIGAKKHATVGKSAQWKDKLSPVIQENIKKKYGKMLIDLGYENDTNW